MTRLSARATASVIRQRLNGGLPDRAPSTETNPVGNTARVTRAQASLQPSASPAIKHPKLNTTPWSSTYAIQRKPMPKSKSKQMPYK